VGGGLGHHEEQTGQRVRPQRDDQSPPRAACVAPGGDAHGLAEGVCTRIGRGCGAGAHTAAQQDAVQVAAAGGGKDRRPAARNDLLLPVVKGLGAERAYEMIALSLQTLAARLLRIPDRAS